MPSSTRAARSRRPKRLKMPPSTIAALYHTWLTSAPSDALDALGELDDAKARGVASGLLALIGDESFS